MHYLLITKLTWAIQEQIKLKVFVLQCQCTIQMNKATVIGKQLTVFDPSSPHANSLKGNSNDCNWNDLLL